MVGEQEVEVERQRGDKVDDVDGLAEKRQLAGADDKPDDDLEREPGIADALDVEEGVVRVGPLLVQHPRRCTAVGPHDGRRRRQGAAGEPHERNVLDRRNAHARMRLDAERQDWHNDKEHGHGGRHLRQQNMSVFCYK